ncbi:MAG: hypothetical protein Q7R96_04550 [Nanoarchaeota archaeon]|nr:hypothetical protein [Nanoarchaeota archaeon]
MQQVKIYIPDIECESCTKVLSKRFAAVPGLKSFVFQEDGVLCECENPQIVVHAVQQAGFRAGLNPFARMSFRERFKDFFTKKDKYVLEWKMVHVWITLLFVLSLIEGLAYYFLFKSVPDFLPKYGWWVVYSIIIVASFGAALWHRLSYKMNVTCMVGMMIGMTMGMQTGLLLGALVGATNGFFLGAMVGMVAGVLVGGLAGKCCGIMGVMEGLMAGVMGGTMGAMITVMLLFDNVFWFMPFFTFINIVIVFGLSYMLFEESVEHRQDVVRDPVDMQTVIYVCSAVVLLITAVMVYGPKAVVVA